MTPEPEMILFFLELLVKTENSSEDQAPIINFIEVIGEDSINVAGIPAGGAQ